MLLFPLARAAGAQPSCSATDLAQLEAVLSTGGTLDLDCSGSIEIDETLVADGVNATVRGDAVSITRNTIGPALRLLDVRGSTLTLDGIDFREGSARGADGPDGEHGEDGEGGIIGPNGGVGANGTLGTNGGDATEAGADGGSVSGGAMLIDGGAAWSRCATAPSNETRRWPGPAATVGSAGLAGAAARVGAAARAPAGTQATARTAPTAV